MRTEKAYVSPKKNLNSKILVAQSKHFSFLFMNFTKRLIHRASCIALRIFSILDYRKFNHIGRFTMRKTHPNFLFAFMAVMVWLSGLAIAVLVNTDDIYTYLEDKSEIQNHPDYPVRVTGGIGLDEIAIIEKDVAVPMRDGINLSANIYRPKSDGQYPVIMALTAYNKNFGPKFYPKHLRSALQPDFDHGVFEVSQWTTWEGPDPSYWVKQGYAVVYLDSRGFGNSDGAPSTLSIRDRSDFADAINWAGTRDWSNGNVGLSGVSYLAIAQWVAASGRPKHLKAISPWEGQSDPYREVLYHGGIPSTGFTSFWLRKMRAGANGNPLPPPPIFNFVHQRPALMKQLQQRPQAKSGIDLPSIHVPALICASWSDQGLHTRGSFEGFKQISSKQKWLYTHGGKKWEVYYSDEALAVQTAFFDHFLKGKQNGFDSRPPVRLEVRETREKYKVRFVEDWPVPNTKYKKLFIDAETSTLDDAASETSGSLSYDPIKNGLSLRYVFDRDTEITGNMKLRLWVSASAGEDMDLFVAVQKRDSGGAPVYFNSMAGYEKGPVALGWLRASQRQLDPVRSTESQPVLLHKDPQYISPDEKIAVDIEILPSSTLYRKGETLELVIKGKDIFTHSKMAHGYGVNEGVHTLYAGGEDNSYLLLPIID